MSSAVTVSILYIVRDLTIVYFSVKVNLYWLGVRLGILESNNLQFEGCFKDGSAFGKF